MPGCPDIASTAGLFADPTRARIVAALVDGRALPASVVAAEGGVSASTASGHLSKLVEGGVLRVERSGRHRYYRLAGPEIAAAFEALASISPQPPVRSLRESTQAAAMRSARTCYDHLAGRWGVTVTEALVDAGALVRIDGGRGIEPGRGDRLSAPARSVPYELGPSAGDVLARLHVDLDPLLARSRSARPLLRFCVDWSEQRLHLSGALGAAVLDAAVSEGWIDRYRGARTVHVTDAGETALRDALGIDAPDAAAIS